VFGRARRIEALRLRVGGPVRFAGHLDPEVGVHIRSRRGARALAEPRTLDVAPVTRLRPDARAPVATGVDQERLARDSRLGEIARELLDVVELVGTWIARLEPAAVVSAQHVVAGDVGGEAADLLRAARAVEHVLVDGGGLGAVGVPAEPARVARIEGERAVG